MAGKKGSTPYTAPAVGEATSGWQPPTSRQPGEGRGQDGRESARNEEEGNHQSAPERQSTMDSQRPPHDRKAPRGMLDRSLQARLGRQLRSIYSDTANQPVPERFIKLLEELEAREKRG